jgi:uncharacterized protein YndB with AHSA1/START domain
MTQAAVEPVRCSVVVRRPLEETFDLFTDRLDTWWPLDTHSIAADTFENRVTVEWIAFEKHVGGRVVEHMSDGTEAAWGTFLAWEPPRRFVMTWKPTLVEGPATEVELRFDPVDADHTRIEVVHRGWERLADAAEKRGSYRRGWEALLERFEQLSGYQSPA